jgi:hypothetical protein
MFKLFKPFNSLNSAMAGILKNSSSFPRKWTSGQGFRPQPIGLCRNGQPRQPRSLLIPKVQAWQHFYGSTSAAYSLALRSSFDHQVEPQ